MRLIPLLILGSCLCCMVGCTPTASENSWIAARGGELHDSRQARAEAALALLANPVDRQVHVAVLDSDTVCAYGWPNGRIYVTRALVDILNDQELAAALAHEMGHLLNDGRLHSVVSLRGCASTDVEVRADAAGAQLLSQCGLSQSLMPQMLRKVNSSDSLAPTCHAALAQRIQILTLAR